MLVDDLAKNINGLNVSDHESEYTDKQADKISLAVTYTVQLC